MHQIIPEKYMYVGCKAFQGYKFEISALSFVNIFINLCVQHVKLVLSNSML